LFGRTVIEDVGALLWVDGVPAEERDRSARRAMAEVGLAPAVFADRFPLSLSEGEKRRVALAGALAEPPHVLLLDEPTAGLDPEGRRSLAVVIRRLRERGRTVVFASHDLDFVGAVADRVVVLARAEGASGRVLAQGAAQEMLRDARTLDRACLPRPDFVLLERALREAGVLGPARASVRDAESLLEELARAAHSTALKE
jgi:energy-coupling factor transporter ATP-binding protein EcfA2